MFKIAHYTETWNDWHGVEDTTRGNKAEASSQERSTSRSIQGAYQILKLNLYSSTWEERWEFVLELLDLKLADWLSYLADTRHMDNLWIERQSLETLKSYDSSSGEGGFIERMYPEYHLSDSTLLWLAVQQLENLIRSIEDRSYLRDWRQSNTTNVKAREARRCLDFYQDKLNSRKLQSNIIKTFLVSRRESSTWSMAMDKVSSGSAGVSTITRTDPMTEGSRNLPSIDEQKVQPGIIVPIDLPDESETQVFAFQRTINEYVFEVQSTDVATIEASVWGLFDGTQDIKDSWRKTLKIQESNTIPTTFDPRQIALALYASEYRYKLMNWNQNYSEEMLYDRLLASLYDSGAFAQRCVDGAPETMRSWTAASYETLSLLIATIYRECKINL